MIRCLGIVVLGALGLLAIGCGDSTSDACLPGLRVSCSCDGGLGWSTCLGDGTFSSCDCNVQDAGDGCDPGFHLCGVTCVEDESVLACGDSCTPCPSGEHATPTCDGTSCGLACNRPWEDCDGDATNGCEVDTSAPENCGTCGGGCVEPDPLCALVGEAYECVDGCFDEAPTRCSGSCVDLVTNTNHCGECDNLCPDPPNAVGFCEDSGCSFTCLDDWGDCDGLPETGCESSLSSIAHCGMCGNSCNDANRCTDDVCDPTSLTCTNADIVPCCGNDTAEAGEICDGTDDDLCVDGCATSCTCVVPSTCPRVVFTSADPTGNCGFVEDATGTRLIDIDCGNIYIGGGPSMVPPNPLVGGITSWYDVVDCSDPANYVLGPSRGTGRNDCTSNDCFYGPPVEIASSVFGFDVRVCAYTYVDGPVSGTLDLTTGHINLEVPLRTETFTDFGLIGMPCPRCVMDMCVGGSTPGAMCSINGPDGTSTDCAPRVPGFLDTTLPISFENLTTRGRDETDPAGLFVPIQTVATAGAFGQPTATRISLIGTPATGITVNGPPIAATMSSVFAIPATGGLADGASGIPGPGAVGQNGELQVVPRTNCGDNVIDFGETCDGTETGPCLGTCASDCTCTAMCGDDFRDPGEECDGVATGSCLGTCDPGCTCTPVCGDNTVNAPMEECDGTDPGTCMYGCTTLCTCAPSCGNDMVDPGTGEVCDGSDDSACMYECDGTCACFPALYGSNVDMVATDSIVVIGPVSGTDSNVSTLTMEPIHGLAYDTVSGVLYGVGGASGGALFTVDPLTGTTTLVGETGLVDLQALAYYSGSLYTVDNNTVVTTARYRLHRIDGYATGALVVTNTTANLLQRTVGLTVDAAIGRLYAVRFNGTSSLVSSAELTMSPPPVLNRGGLGGIYQNVQSLAFHGGALYGTDVDDDQLVTRPNPLGGAARAVAPGVLLSAGDVRALVFAP